MKIKHLKRIISSSIYALLIAVVLLCSPFCAQAQTGGYEGSRGEIIGTPDSRMVLSIKETTDHVELQVMGIGQILTSAMVPIIIYNPTNLALTDETFGIDIPDGISAMAVQALAPVIKIDPQFKAKHIDKFLPIIPLYVDGTIAHQGILGGTRKMLHTGLELLTTPVETYGMAIPAGEMQPVVRLFFRKKTPGKALETSDFGFYNNKNIPRATSYWVCNGFSVRFDETGSSIGQYVKPDQFIYRSPSYSITSPVTNILGTQANFNGTFKRGDFAPSSTMEVAGMSGALSSTGRLNYDDIVNYGFIYAEEDHDISVIGVVDSITIDGTTYKFPTPAQLAGGSFTFGTTTLYFKPFVNSNPAQAFPENLTVTGLTANTEYFVWTYEQFKFETSNNYLYVGNRIAFTTSACENIPLPIASAKQSFCGGAPTIADLVAEVGTNDILVWYNAEVDGDAYALTDPLVDGGTYYARAIVSSCESESVAVTVSLLNTLAAPSATTPQEFCSGALVSNLRASGNDIKWYDEETGGRLVPSTEKLVDGEIYWAEQTSATCGSSTRTAVKVNITNATELAGPVIESPQFFCFNATLEDIATDGSDVVWYSTGGALLQPTTYLQNGMTYYAAKFSGDCESAERTPVLVYTGMPAVNAPKVGSPQRMFEGSTLKNITVPNNKIIWYASEDAVTPLAQGTILGDNVTYYAAQAAGECESAKRTPVLILINGTGVPGPDIESPQVICSDDKTLADLTVTGGGIVWFDENGVELPLGTLLPSTPTYWYAAQSSNGVVGEKVGVLVSASPEPTPDVAPIAVCINGSGNGSIGDGNSATFDLTTAVTPNPDYIYVYYDENGNEIKNPAETGMPSTAGTYTYYVKTIDKVTGCESMTAIDVTINAAPEVTVTPAGAYTSVDGETTLTVTDSNTTTGTKTIVIRDPSIADVTLVDGVITVVGKAKGNTEIVYTSIDENGCVTEVIIPVQVEGMPTGILTGKDIFVCNGDDEQTVQIAYIMGGIAPWTVTISDDRGTFTETVTIPSIDVLPVNVNVTLPDNTSDVPEFTTFVISNVTDSKGASKDVHYGAVRFGVNPTPVVSDVANREQVICSGSATLPISVDGVATTYRFSVSENIGTINYTNNSVPSFIAVNNSTAAVTATITIIPEYWYNGIVCIGEAATATITVNPTPTVAPVENKVVAPACDGSDSNLVVAFAGNANEYNWTVSGAAIGLAAAGEGNIDAPVVNNTNAPLVATITVTPKFTAEGECEGTPISFTVTVMPNVTPSMHPVVAEHNLCNGMMTDAINFSSDVVGTIYSWTVSGASIGLPASGNGNIASFRAINNGTSAATATITVTPKNANGCEGTAQTITINVQPTPFAAPEFDATLCVGATVAEVTGTNFTWTQTGSNIGLAQTFGTGTIPSFTTANNTLLPQTATFAITPMSGTCAGTPVSFTVTVLPEVGVNAVASQEVCDGQMTAPVAFSGKLPGTVYRWTNSNPAIGLAASGAGDIASFRAVGGTAIEVATITVTPEYTHSGLTCPTITPITFTITVNPDLTIGTIFDSAYCNGVATDVVTLPSDATWVHSGSNIGSAMSGTGSIPSFIATNTTANLATGVFTVTLASGNCSGSTATYTVAVSPELRLTSAATMPETCANVNYAVRSNVSGAAITWSRAAISGINNGAAGEGTGAQISEVLTNTTDAPITVTYEIGMTFGDCSNADAPATVTVVVNPTPEVAMSSAFETVCLGALSAAFAYELNADQADMDIEYSISFSPAAIHSGFANVSKATLAGDAITVAIPAGLPAGEYSGTFSFNAEDGGCADVVAYPFTIQVMGGIQITSQPTAATFCEGEGFVLSVSATGGTGVNLTYQWYFNNEAIEGANSAVLAIAPEDALSYIGIFFVEITSVNGCGGTVRSMPVDVAGNILFILQKWDDVIFVSNLGDIFVGYQWYRNGSAIGKNGNFQYFSEDGGLNGTYEVLVTYADGTQLMSCPYIVTNGSAGAPSILIYPNPVQIGKEIVIDMSQLSIEESMNAKVFIYDASGRLMAYSIVTQPVENITIDVPVAGNYIVRVTTASGRVKSEKVVVVE